MAASFSESPTLATALQDAGFTRRVGVVALFELLALDAVQLQKTASGVVMISGSVTPKQEVLAKLKVFLFSFDEKELFLRAYTLPFRRIMLVGRQFLLRGPEGSFFLPFPGKYKFWLAFIPIALVVGAAVLQVTVLGVVSVVIGGLFFVLAIISFIFIRRLPDHVPLQSEDLRAALSQDWTQASKGELVFWREVWTGKVTDLGVQFAPPAVARALSACDLSVQDARILFWKSLLPEYHRSVVGT